MSSESKKCEVTKEQKDALDVLFNSKFGEVMACLQQKLSDDYGVSWKENETAFGKNLDEFVIEQLPLAHNDGRIIVYALLTTAAMQFANWEKYG